MAGRPRKEEEDKAKPEDRVRCKLCDKYYRRSNTWRHKNTELHKKLATISRDVESIILNKKEEQEDENLYNPNECKISRVKMECAKKRLTSKIVNKRALI